LNGNVDLSKNYLLITPCKNEGDHLPDLIESIASQIIRPIIWIIIDDGSDDNTPQITKEAANKHNWIQILRLDESRKRDLGLHLANIMSKGFNYAIEYCNKNGLEYKYLGNVDGDLTIEHTFFLNLINEFEKNPALGIASGGTKFTINNEVVHVKGLSVDEPSGGHMLIRRKCFEDCAGIPQSYAYDSVLKAKARLGGWTNKRFEDNLATEARDVNSAEGYFKGFLHLGKSHYYLNFHPTHIFASGVLKSFRKPYYGGIIYISSYLFNFLKREGQIEDDVIKDYYWNKWKRIYKNRLTSRVTYEVIK